MEDTATVTEAATTADKPAETKPETETTALTVANTPAIDVDGPKWTAVKMLNCQLSLEIPVPEFTVASLLRLAPNDVINTQWLQGTDVPLYANGKLIAWTEFEVVDERLAVRLTQIA